MREESTGILDSDAVPTPANTASVKVKDKCMATNTAPTVSIKENRIPSSSPQGPCDEYMTNITKRHRKRTMYLHDENSAVQNVQTSLLELGFEYE